MDRTVFLNNSQTRFNELVAVGLNDYAGTIFYQDARLQLDYSAVNTLYCITDSIALLKASTYDEYVAGNHCALAFAPGAWGELIK